MPEPASDDEQILCLKIKIRGSPATAIGVHDIVKAIYNFADLHGHKLSNPDREKRALPWRRSSCASERPAPRRSGSHVRSSTRFLALRVMALPERMGAGRKRRVRDARRASRTVAERFHSWLSGKQAEKLRWGGGLKMLSASSKI